ncbi:hypothetical protein AGDE_16236 [Angomonas deanei]|uniref:Uncharacterized protein n=1 Tax=Angomonas deanei TaxID=59799 RepID=A0A7G2C237_9TRYP|nr:hypothetical protein AGDE_16236 [Angomonas deanei]CAD2213858.1 hypothetical protein, conserved [Angomonas deanei]|eukprot:EPY17474.1 hypothetical protein AGDE_16236 [Angomonas deanei]
MTKDSPRKEETEAAPVPAGMPLQQITLEDGTVAYVPVSAASDDTPRDAQLHDRRSSEPFNDPNDVSGVLFYYNSGRPTDSCRLASRVIVLVASIIGFVLAIVAIAVPLYKGTSCYVDVYYYDYDTGYSISPWNIYCSYSLSGAILMSVGLGCVVTAVVLASISIYTGVHYPRQERADRQNTKLTAESRHLNAMKRIFYDVHITRALFSVLLVDAVFLLVSTILFFIETFAEGNADMVISAPIVLVAFLCVLAATVMTPIFRATGSSLHFPSETKGEFASGGCCYYCC